MNAENIKRDKLLAFKSAPMTKTIFIYQHLSHLQSTFYPLESKVWSFFIFTLFDFDFLHGCGVNHSEIPFKPQPSRAWQPLDQTCWTTQESESIRLVFILCIFPIVFGGFINF